jgi:hypothetical protein
MRRPRAQGEQWVTPGFTKPGTGRFLKPEIPDRYTGQTDRYTDRRLLSGVVSEWYTGWFSYRTGPVTPKIAVYRPVYREKVNPG